MSAIRWEAHNGCVGYVEEGEWTKVADCEGDQGCAESIAARMQFTNEMTDAEVDAANGGDKQRGHEAAEEHAEAVRDGQR
jgi:hypothetical protein